MDEVATDETKWPGFMNITGKTFQYVYTHKPVFVKFTLNDMQQPKGFFKVWYEYCLNKSKRK